VPPPDLAADAPVLEVFQPEEVVLIPLGGIDSGFPFAYGRDRLVRQRTGGHKPLKGEHGLDRTLAAVTVADAVVVALHLDQVTAFFQILDQAFAAGIAIQPGIGSSRLPHGSVFRNNLKQVQGVFPAYLEVIEIMSRGDFERAGPEFTVNVRIGDHRQRPFHQRQQHFLADEGLVARVFRMDRNCGISQHGLGSGGCHNHRPLATDQRVAHVIEVPVELLALDFDIGQSGHAPRAPVDHPLAPVDETFLVEAHKYLPDRPRQALIHGEPLSLPVTGGSQALELVDDDAPIFLAPVPDALQKGFPAQFVPRLLVCRKLPFDHILSGDAGMVGAGYPEHFKAGQPLVAADDVLQRIIEGMPHMQLSRHIGRRNHNTEGWLRAINAGMKPSLLLPAGIPVGFNFMKGIGLGQLAVIHGNAPSCSVLYFLGRRSRTRGRPSTRGFDHCHRLASRHGSAPGRGRSSFRARFVTAATRRRFATVQFLLSAPSGRFQAASLPPGPAGSRTGGSRVAS